MCTRDVAEVVNGRLPRNFSRHPKTDKSSSCVNLRMVVLIERVIVVMIRALYTLYQQYSNEMISATRQISNFLNMWAPTRTKGIWKVFFKMKTQIVEQLGGDHQIQYVAH
jgi:hypothetical protein